MNEEQIRQNAYEYLANLDRSGILLTGNEVYLAYIEGAHSQNSEIEALKTENKTLKETLSVREAEITDMEFLRKQDKELLNNAVSLLKEMYEDDDYFCTRLLDIPEEEKMCEIYCDKEGVQCDCILRYLKHYKKE